MVVSHFINMESSVDWCEINYDYTDYIAEFWNTLSSLTLFISGLYGFHLHKAKNGSGIFIILSLVGLGSVLFHAFLSHFTQMLDEIPMLYMVAMMFSNLWSSVRYVRFITFSIATYLSFCIAKYGSSSDLATRTFEFIFFQSIIITISFLLFASFLRKISVKDSGMLVDGISWFGVGWICWLLDYFCCAIWTRFGNPQFHALWHIFSAIGVYQLSYISIHVSNVSQS